MVTMTITCVVIMVITTEYFFLALKEKTQSSQIGFRFRGFGQLSEYLR